MEKGYILRFHKKSLDSTAVVTGLQEGHFPHL